jgi:hypothetical protein
VGKTLGRFYLTLGRQQTKGDQPMTYTLESRLNDFIELRDHLKTVLDDPTKAEDIAAKLLMVNYIERLENKFLKQELGY